MQLFLTEFFTVDSTVVVIVIVSVVLAIGLLLASRAGGNFFGKFKVGVVSAEVDSSTPATIDIKGASAGKDMEIHEGTGGRIVGETLEADGNLSIRTELPSDRRRK